MLDIFVTIAAVLVVFSCLYVLLDKTGKKGAKYVIDAVFLTIIFVFICMPCMRLIDDEYNNIENRSYVVKPNLFDENKKINNFYGKAWDDYLKDRTFFRYPFIKSYFYTIGDINDIILVNGITYNKKTKRMFLYSNFAEDYLDKDVYQKAVLNLHKLSSFCNLNGIKLYVLFFPSQDMLMKETSPYKLEQYRENKKLIMNKLQKEFNFPIIYPINDVIEEGKINPVIYRTDIHLTENATYKVYKALMNVIKKDFPSVKIVPESSYDITTNKKVRNSDWEDIFIDGGLIKHAFQYCRSCKNLFDTDYLYYDFKNDYSSRRTVTDISHLKSKGCFYPEGADLRVLMAGTSVNESLYLFIPYTFKNVKYIRLNNVKGIDYDEGFKIMKYYEKIIKRYKPDIIIFSVMDDNIFQLENLFNYD